MRQMPVMTLVEPHHFGEPQDHIGKECDQQENKNLNGDKGQHRLGYINQIPVGDAPVMYKLTPMGGVQ
jgi:hypothetical protein